ncbi:MAG TPA: trigger factor [bacterium]|nr:trigger factor [bacterium]
MFGVFDVQVTLETAEGLLRRLSIHVPAARLEEATELRLKEIGRRVRVDGFRPGKVPAQVIRQRYLPQAREEALDTIVQSTYGEALQQQSLTPAGAPRITDFKLPEGEEGLRYVAEIEVYPEITLAAMSEIKIERPQTEISEADVDVMIDNLRKQRATFAVVERAAADGDRVTVDFKGSIDGEAFDGGSGENMPIILGQGALLKDFEAPIVGMKAGEAKTIEVTFPADYHAEPLRGKVASFEISVKSVEETVLPELDDAFCEAFGVKEGGAATLRDEVRKNMARELEQAIKRSLKLQVMEGLLAANEFAVPQSMIQEESARVREQFTKQMRGAPQGELPLKLFEGEAVRRVKLGLLVSELVKSSELRVEPERLNALLDTIAASYEDPEEVKNYYRSRADLMQNLRDMAAEERVVDFVLEAANVVDVPTAFADVVKPAQ